MQRFSRFSKIAHAPSSAGRGEKNINPRIRVGRYPKFSKIAHAPSSAGRGEKNINLGCRIYTVSIFDHVGGRERVGNNPFKQ